MDPRIHIVGTGTWERIWLTLRRLQIPPRIIGGKTGGNKSREGKNMARQLHRDLSYEAPSFKSLLRPEKGTFSAREA